MVKENFTGDKMLAVAAEHFNAYTCTELGKVSDNDISRIQDDGHACLFVDQA